MKKNKFIILIVNIFVACALMLFISAAVMHLDYAVESPFGLVDNYMAFIVSKHQPIDDGEVQSMLNEMYTILQHNGILLIFNNFDSLGTGLYDPMGYYAYASLYSGDYFDPDDFSQNTSWVLIKSDSSAHHMLNQGSTILDGVLRPVKGIYDNNHPLYSDHCEYIFNFFSATDIRGRYYVQGIDTDCMEQIVVLLQDNGYIINFIDTENKPGSMLLGMFTGILPVMAAGMVFIYFNYFLLYLNILSRYKRVFMIHLWFGATNMRILVQLVAGNALPIISGSLLATILPIWLFRFSDFELSFLQLFVSIMANSMFSLLILVLAFHLFNLGKDRSEML